MKVLSPDEIITSLNWAVKQAEEMLGAHTGGPNEQAYREQLIMAREAVLALNAILRYSK